MTDYDGSLVDPARSTGLGDVGAPEYIAATAVGADGATHLVLARRDALGDDDVRYDASCSRVLHEAAGPLPLEFVRRLTISRRQRRRETP